MKTSNSKFQISDFKVQTKGTGLNHGWTSEGPAVERDAVERVPAARKGRRGFTLIEMLVVIAVLGILAALIIPITGKTRAIRIRNRVKGELKLVESRITDYKTKFGYFPPDNPTNYAVNPLYYELLGVFQTNISGSAYYQTLDASAQFQDTSASFQATYGLAPAPVGYVNCTKGGGGDEGEAGGEFLSAGFEGGAVSGGDAAGFDVSLFGAGDVGAGAADVSGRESEQRHEDQSVPV